MNSSDGALSHLSVLSHFAHVGQVLLVESGWLLNEELESESAHGSRELVGTRVVAGTSEPPKIMDRLTLAHFIRHDAEVLQLGHAE